jgi:hypothetical protein
MRISAAVKAAISFALGRRRVAPAVVAPRVKLHRRPVDSDWSHLRPWTTPLIPPAGREGAGNIVKENHAHATPDFESRFDPDRLDRTDRPTDAGDRRPSAAPAHRVADAAQDGAAAQPGAER